MLRLLSLWDVKTKYFYLKKKLKREKGGTKFSVKSCHAGFQIVNRIMEGQRATVQGNQRSNAYIRLSIEGYMKRLK